MSKELVKFEEDLFQEKMNVISTGALDPAGQIALSPEEIKQRIKTQKATPIPEINDQDTDSNILNN
jgi:tetratricopeptide (TPR) repeat protein